MEKSIVSILLLVLAVGCSSDRGALLESRPGGPYRLTLAMNPAVPIAGRETQLEFHLTYTKNGKPVSDLQLAHERLIHNFVVKLDFSSFAHIHHEDFEPVSDLDRDQGTLRFPYKFPSAGRYRIVSEFAHRNRSWVKHFDIDVGSAAPALRPTPRGLTDEKGQYAAELAVEPRSPIAGSETDMTLTLARAGEPVRDLALHLGSEMHGAVWRDDGGFFGHLHSYTPKVAAILDMAHQQGGDPAGRGARIQEMMVQLMCLEAELVFPGPTIPIKYVFPEAGRYFLFLQVAPGGDPQVFQFALDVAAPGSDGSVSRPGDAADPIPVAVRR